MKQETSYGAIVFRNREKREVLLVQQQNGDWGFPKGHREAGETERETLVRELAEETGITSLEIDSDVIPLRMTYQFVNHEGVEVDKTVLLYVGYSSAEPRVVLPDEILHVGWYSVESALDMITHSESRNLLVNVCKSI